MVLPGGKTVERVHPIRFASKRTSPAEEKYKPFLLEFAALKFGLDKFSNIIWGSPVHIETDCQALRDVLLNDKLNATHAQWRDGIIAHNITDVQHVPGRINLVADGLSRMDEGKLLRTGVPQASGN
jgi:RNase H-like domain found in reverse transcriptase